MLSIGGHVSTASMKIGGPVLPTETLEPARDGPGSALRFLVRARIWPGGQKQILAECHPHGPPVNWQ